MDRWRGSVAVVTGAATGIGRSTVSLLLEHRVKVVGCGRRIEALQALSDEFGSKGELTVIQCDVSKDSDVDKLFCEIAKKYGGVDICINCAAIVISSNSILYGENKNWQATFDINVMGVLRMTKAAVASMKAKKSVESHIININSVLGHFVPNEPKYIVYTASKYALTAITQGTRFELLAENAAGLNCRVSQISPGIVDTPIHLQNSRKEDIEAGFQACRPLDAVDVAEAVIFQLSLPPHVQVQDIILRATPQPVY